MEAKAENLSNITFRFQEYQLRWLPYKWHRRPSVGFHLLFGPFLAEKDRGVICSSYLLVTYFINCYNLKEFYLQDKLVDLFVSKIFDLLFTSVD